MSTEANRRRPSWWLLFAASVVVGPAVLAGVWGAVVIVEGELWKRPPEIRPVTADPPLRPDGVIAFVERPRSAGMPVHAGERAPGSIPELVRTAGRRGDGTRVYAAAVAEDITHLGIRRPGSPKRSIVSFDGPRGYMFGSPQWSPDGEWILVSDTEGRLLILDEEGDDIRELLPAKRTRSWVETPYLTWHQGTQS